MATDLDWFVVIEFNQASGQPSGDAGVWLCQSRSDADDEQGYRTGLARANGRREKYRVFALEPVEDDPAESSVSGAKAADQ